MPGTSPKLSGEHRALDSVDRTPVARNGSEQLRPRQHDVALYKQAAASLSVLCASAQEQFDPLLHADAALSPFAPSTRDLALAQESRSIKVYVYDFEEAGFALPLNASDAYSTACTCGASVIGHGTAPDPCNNGLGRLHSRTFATAYQGNYWGNFRGGQDNSKVARARLQTGYRRVFDPNEAHLFYLPLEVYDVCQADKRSFRDFHKGCGLPFRDLTVTHDFPAMWRWLLAQPAFAQSDGTDHFLFTEFPYKAGQLSYLRDSVRKS